jgi:hypothetical protein
VATAWPRAASLLLLLPVSAAGAQEPASSPAPVSVRARASKAEVTVGETFEIEVQAQGPQGTTYTFPAQASEERFEMKTAKAAPDAPAPPVGTHRYQASVFALGGVRIPPIPVRYRLPDGQEGEAQTAPLDLKVASVLPRDKDEQKLADIRGPAAVGIGRAFWLALLAAAVLVGLLVAWLARRRLQVPVPGATAEPLVPPDAEALTALEALVRSERIARGEYRAFYIELTIVAKRYLERRLGAPVLEMTSAEMTAFLRAHPHGGELVPVARDLASAADRIKFAQGEGMAAEAERHLAAVRAAIPALEARLRPPPGEKEEGRAA